jgi:hypothetical protein
MDERRHKLIPGLMLTAMGVLFLIILNTQRGSPFILAAIGVSFLVAFAWTREYHLLVPGCLLAGLGLGIAVRPVGWEQGAPVLIGLGAGLVGVHVLSGIWVGDTPPPRTWLLPGTALFALGVVEALATGGLLRFLVRWWPLALVVAGGFMLWTERRGAATTGGGQ